MRQWNSQEAHQRTAAPDAASQYNPHFFGTDEAVQELEMKCVEKGMLISESVHRRTYYMKVDEIVGVCRGEETNFVFAEETSGNVHGRPISKAALREMGVVV